MLQLFARWQPPDIVIFHQFLVRVGELGGYAVVETEDSREIHGLTSAYAVFRFRVEPVPDVMDAVTAEQDAIGWRRFRRGS